MLGVADRDAYLARLQLEPEPPSVEALFRLHRAKVERVAYETVWIHQGQRWDIALEGSVSRIAHERRGGYCFHLNGAFSWLLSTLGYEVTRHVGGVHGPEGANPDAMTNHLVLNVHGLPAAENPTGTWYVDAGLGDALYEPLPLLPGKYRQEPFDFVLEQTSEGVGDWHLVHDPAGAFTGMAWNAAPATMGEFKDRHIFLSTSPESGFVRVMTAQRRDASGVDILRSLRLQRLGDRAGESTVETKAELVDVLGDLFGLDLGMADASALDALWARVHAAHVAWLAKDHS